MNKPTPKQLDAMKRLQGPLFEEFLGWFRDNLAIDNRNLHDFKGDDLLNLQGEAKTLETILTTTDGADALPGRAGERAGRVNTR